MCIQIWSHLYNKHFDGLVQERRNSIANALELRLSRTNPSICKQHDVYVHVCLSEPPRPVNFSAVMDDFDTMKVDWCDGTDPGVPNYTLYWTVM